MVDLFKAEQAVGQLEAVQGCTDMKGVQAKRKKTEDQDYTLEEFINALSIWVAFRQSLLYIFTLLYICYVSAPKNQSRQKLMAVDEIGLDKMETGVDETGIVNSLSHQE